MSCRARAISVCLLLLVGCDEEEAPPPSEPTLPTLARAWTVAVPNGRVFAVADEIRIDGQNAIVALEDRRLRPRDKEGGAAGLLVSALDAYLKEAPFAGETADLAIDERVPFQTLAEVAYTVAQANRVQIALLVRHDGELRALPIMLPSYGREEEQLDPLRIEEPEEELGTLSDVLAGGAVTCCADEVLAAEAEPEANQPEEAELEEDEPPAARTVPPRALRPSPLHLNVTILRTGIVVATGRNALDPDCESTRSLRVITVPRREGTHDIAAFARCLAKAHTLYPTEDTVTVSASPDTRFGDVARVIAAARGTPGAPLFPRTRLSTNVH